MKRVLIIAALALWSLSLGAQGKMAGDFRKAADSLSVLMQERTLVKVNIQIKSIMKRGNELDFYFTQTLGDYPWRPGDAEWFRKKLSSLFPKGYNDYNLGDVYALATNIDELQIPALHNDGKVHESSFRRDNPPRHRFVYREGGQKFNKGLSGRNIALWQSHGLYWAEKLTSWRWQRAKNFTTVEDMYTQSYVLPFLIPMLENAGAYVLTPRERDTQRWEVVCDNDPAFKGPRDGMMRRQGSYTEKGAWEQCGTGFADARPYYTGTENPFTMGTARKGKGTVRATWSADIPERGEYAVYVAYKTVSGSTSAAKYTVTHLGGSTDIIVNQQMGGGTWIYLGTWEFEGSGSVTVRNAGSGVLTADAVRFGGGMGKVARGDENEISGVPSYMEGALYNMQYAGMDSTIIRRWNDDYTDDYADRGAWVCRLSGGSWSNPKDAGLGIPVDLSLAFHSDAGVTPNDSIVGTLAIYTLKCDGSDKLPNGEERMICREYTDYVQSQVVSDIRALHNPDWSRRGTWDRSYSECRTSGVPGMILEILAHQNFADMKYGLDPSFRFTVSRAVYKGMLKFLSNRYGCPYAVQPLPVEAFSVTFKEDHLAHLSWKAVNDPLEPTARPSGYVLYTRRGDAAFDDGRILETYKSGEFICADVPIEGGRLFSFKVAAFNEGGLSFPSETLCIGAGGPDKVLIVNNFDRISAPAWFDTPTYAGFDSRLDGGVPYMKDITYIGEMYQFRRQLPWTDDENAGFGSSYTDEAGIQAAGNTFDFPYKHARAAFSRGYSVCSSSSKAFAADSTIRSGIFATDIICGKQVTTPGAVNERFQVFPIELQKAIASYCEAGGNILVSGANIGTDVWDMVYPVSYDEKARTATKEFINKYLGYTWLTGYASRTGEVKPMKGAPISVSGPFSFNTALSEKIYRVETPDGINPVSGARTFLRYGDTNVSAAVCLKGSKWKAVSVGFPLETVTRDKDLQEIMNKILTYFKKQ